MNSFRFIERGIRAEIARQEKILRGGGQVVQETLHFDPASGAITSLRSKEEAHDYRYFPEPDLVPVAIDEADARGAPGRDAGAAGRARAALRARARSERRQRPAAGVPRRAGRLLRGRARAPGRSTGAAGAGPRQLESLGELRRRRLTRTGEDPGGHSRVARGALAALVGLVAAKRISVGAARQVLDRLVAEGGDPAAIVQAEGLAAIDGGDELAEIVAAALAANADAAERVREGNAKAIGPIVGHVMRETKGRADGGEVARLVHEQLGV